MFPNSRPRTARLFAGLGITSLFLAPAAAQSATAPSGPLFESTSTLESETAAAASTWAVRLRGGDLQRHQLLKQIGAMRQARDQAGFDAALAALGAHFEAEAAPLASYLREQGLEVQHVPFARALLFAGASPTLRSALEARGDVQRVERGVLRGPAMAKATNAAHHDSVGANLLQAPGGQLVQGQGVTIAILDTGIDADHAGSGRPHAAFFPNGNPALQTGGGIGGSRLLSTEAGFTWGSANPEDDHGHGTRVASIAAGAQFNFLPDVANAPARKAGLRTYRITGDVLFGLASTMTMTPAFQAAGSAMDVLVCNMSYDGDDEAGSVLNHTIDDLSTAGVLVTLSAGNQGAGAEYFHGAYNALVVGASDVDTKEPYDFPGFMTSAVGPRVDGRSYPDLIAVGEALTCADLDNEAGSIDSYGSSGAAALTASTAALVRQAAPSASALATKALLLNTVQDVTLGNPDARGLGYLHAKSAVQAALALDWTGGTLAVGNSDNFAESFTAGEEVSLTLAWERVGDSVPDLDLYVQGPLGQPVAFSSSDRDNVEQLRFTAPYTGLYTVSVRGMYVVDQGAGGTDYVLAGAQSAPIPQPIQCVGTFPQIVQVVPTVVETTGPFSQFTLKGCNLAGVQSASLGGVSASFQQKGAYEVGISVPMGAPLGNQLVSITNSGGTHSAFVQVGAGGPKLIATHPTIDNGSASLWLESQPGDLYWAGTSWSQIPSVLPGFLELGIGNNFASIFLYSAGIVPPAGSASVNLSGLGGLPTGIFLYFQCAVLDGVTLTAPLGSTNVVNLIKTF